VNTQNAPRAKFQVNFFKMASVEALYGVISLLFLSSISLASVPSERHVKFQYKHSFKGPHLVNKDGAIPFWNHGGSKYPLFCQVNSLASSVHVYVEFFNGFW